MLRGKPAGRTTLRSCSCASVRNVLALLLSCTVAGLADPAASVTILRVRPLDGEGQVFATNSRTSRPLLVQVTDETGKPVSGATVSFSLPNEGPGGVFTGNMRTDIAVTGDDGRAGMSTASWNNTPGPFSVRVTAAKDGIRAGIVVAEYLSDTVQPSSVRRAAAGTRHGKWMKIGLLAAGAAAGGLALGWAKGEKAASPVEQPIAVQIGTPTITVGNH